MAIKIVRPQTGMIARAGFNSGGIMYKDAGMRRDAQGFAFRLLLLSVLLIVPFLRMLLRDGYGLLYPEVMAALLLFVGVAACLAAVSRNRWIFFTAVAAVIAIHSVNSVQLDFFPSVHLRWLLAGI